MAVGDNSPTSGGSGDVIVTEDTYTDSLTGTSGAKLPVSKIRRGGQGRDAGDVEPSNEFDVHDYRGLVAAERNMAQVVNALYGIIRSVESRLNVRPTSATNARTIGVKGSASSVQLIDVGTGRLGMLVVNDTTSSGNLYISFGPNSGAGIGSGQYATIRIAPGALYEVPSFAVDMSIQGIWDSVTTPGFANVTEFY